jgi:hypothetical protein
MMLYIAATTMVVSTTIVIERKKRDMFTKYNDPSTILVRYCQTRRSGICMYKNYSMPF